MDFPDYAEGVTTEAMVNRLRADIAASIEQGEQS
jgi:hypothetical protein